MVELQIILVLLQWKTVFPDHFGSIMQYLIALGCSYNALIYFYEKPVNYSGNKHDHDARKILDVQIIVQVCY